MKRKITISILLLLFCVTVQNAHGQYRDKYYDFAAGLRLGNASGITGKMFLGTRLAVEGILTTRWDGLNVTGLLEGNHAIGDTPGLSFFYGGGANVGFWDTPENSEQKTEFFLGATGIIGMEYTFQDLPLNLAIDWKPMFTVISVADFVWDEFALSVRYVIR